MKHKILLASAAALLCVAALLSAPSAAQRRRSPRPRPTPSSDAFKLACATPSFPSPAPSHALVIDEKCGPDGNGTGAEAAQNDAKNNFCASGTPQPITIAQMRQLQTQAEQNPAINFGNSGPNHGPTNDRAPLQALGEGRLVTIEKVYVLISRQEGGESVNCGKAFPAKDDLSHDIHISLVDSPTVTKADECQSVVAEMSPHHRPDSWNKTTMAKVAARKVPVRVTGQLLFDSSHFICKNGARVDSNPSRSSLWEIHPVYKFEVCTAGCTGAGTWVPLDQWAKTH